LAQKAIDGSQFMRVLKEYEVRKGELLDAAQKLFFEQGYETTTVSAIIHSVGVAKGTFYHYFKSKEDLLDELVQRFSRQLVERLKKIAENSNQSALDKINTIFAEGGNYKLAHKDLMVTFMRVLYRDENTILRHKLFQGTSASLTPILTKIIQQGQEEGVFHISWPEQTSEMIWLMCIPLNESIVKLLLTLDEKPENKELIYTKLLVFENAIERILGAPKGTISLADRSVIDAFTIDPS
jgi:AcrR family transcriptional regulator